MQSNATGTVLTPVSEGGNQTIPIENEGNEVIVVI
jgi:hypothetical protein